MAELEIGTYHRKTFQALYVIFAAIVASVGGVLFGYDIGITSGALLQLKKDFDLNSFEQEMVVSSVLIGSFFASFFGGNIVDSWGRKAGISISCFLFIVGAIALCFSINLLTLIIGRLIVGIAVSLSVTSECSYISEISPPSRRGMMVSLNEVGITVGFLLAYLVNFLFITTHKGWKYMFGAAAIFAVIQAFGVALMPKSHYFLLIKGQNDKARQVLRSLRNSNDVEEEMEAIIASIEEQKNYRYVDLFSNSANMRNRMLLGITLVILQQFSGHANVLFYAPTVFQHFGYSSDSLATLVTVGLGIVKVVATTFTLLIVDRVGRRCLLLVGCLLMATSVMTLGIVGTVTDVDNMNHKSPVVDLSAVTQSYDNLTHEGDNSSVLHELDLRETQSNKHETEDRIHETQSGRTLKVLEVTYVNSSEVNGSNITEPFEGSENIRKTPLWVKIISVISLMTFVCAYGISYGPVTWLVLSEIFPGSLRGRAISVATSLNWGSNIVVSLTFLDILNKIGIGPTFVGYGFISFGAAIFVFMCVPETKNKTLEEIDGMLQKGLLQKNSSCVNFLSQKKNTVEETNESINMNSENILQQKEDVTKCNTNL